MTSEPELLRRLAAVQGVIFDVDGCLVLSDGPGGSGGRPLPGAADAIAAVRRAGRRLVAFTNASNHTPSGVAAGLRAIGLPLDVEDVLTPAVVGAEVIRERYGERPVLAFGGSALVEVLAAAGVTVAPERQHHSAAAVVVGWDPRFGQEQLQRAAEAVWAGADLFVTSDARRFASNRGPLAGVAGFISSGLSHVTGQRYEVLGKPSAAAMRVAAGRLGVPAHRILVVGDDLTLEARMARSAGALAVLITTGLHGEPDVAAAPPQDRPDLVLTGLPDLMALWKQADAVRSLDEAVP
jgi:HAD superfamily hydrolase (TIGR01450 family)